MSPPTRPPRTSQRKEGHREQGKLAEQLGLDMDQAFSLLRDRARTSNRRLSDLARAFIDGTEALTGPGREQATAAWRRAGAPLARPRR
jgi:ANTAR domain